MERQWYAASVNLMQPAWEAGQARPTPGVAGVDGGPSRPGLRMVYWRRLAHRESPDLIGHRARVRSVSWSPDGTRLATASWDGTVRIWAVADGREFADHRGARRPGQCRGLVAGRARLATAGWDRTVRVWEAADGRELLALRGHTGRVWAVAWSPDGARLATGSEDGTARVWEAGAGRQVHALGGHEGFVVGVSFSPDGRSLATAGATGRRGSGATTAGRG